MKSLVPPQILKSIYGFLFQKVADYRREHHHFLDEVACQFLIHGDAPMWERSVKKSRHAFKMDLLVHALRLIQFALAKSLTQPSQVVDDAGQEQMTRVVRTDGFAA